MVGFLALSKAFCAQRQGRRDVDCWLEQDTTQGLARHLEAIAMTDPALGGPTRLMQVSTDHHGWRLQLGCDSMLECDGRRMPLPRQPGVY